MRFLMLGPLEVHMQGQPVPLAPGRQHALLADLLIHAGEVVSADRLIDDLWAEEPPATAAHQIQVYISRIRKQLHAPNGSPVLITRSPGYLLDVSPDQTDVHDFLELATRGREDLAAGEAETAAKLFRDALSLWRGPPLAEFTYESFAQGEIARLNDLRLATVEDRITADLALGRHSELASELNSLVRENPLRERFRLQQMLALYRDGRQAEALQAYRDAREALAEDLGIDPAPELQEMERAILRQDPSVAWTDERRDTTMLEAVPAETFSAPQQPAAPRRHRATQRRAVAVAVVLALIATVIAVPVLLTRGPSLAGIPTNSIGRIDAASGRIVEALALNLAPGAMAEGHGALWVANPDNGRVTRIDPQTSSVIDTIDVGGLPSSIAVGDGGVWVTDEAGRTVDLISPQTNAVVARYSVGNGPASVALGFGSVWVANRLDGSVTRLNPQGGRLQARILVGQSPTAIAVGAGGVWVTDSGGERVLEISPSTDTLLQSVHVGGDPEGLAVGAGGVWVANAQDGTVSRVVPTTGSVAQALAVGAGPSSISISGRTVWVTNQFDGTVSRIDAPATGQAEPIRTRSAPVGSAVVGGDLWVAVRGSVTSHRGGTLRVVGSTSPLFPDIDPLTWDGPSWQVHIMTNDGLTAFKRVGGGGGTTIVPDLARALPTATAGGTVYAFELRAGLRYSTGVPVRASDVRRAIERGYQVPGIYDPESAASPGFYDVIVGTAACVPDAARPPVSRCDLSEGIGTDDEAGTVVFHLTRPDPDFLQKLALPMAFPVPAGVPMSGHLTEPVPATGPYRIASYDAKVGMTLVRNGAFHVWSQAAQPDGFPDRIQLTPGVSPRQQVEDVEDGRADWMMDPPPADALSTLTTRFAGRVHPYLAPVTTFLDLNTSVAPFNNDMARRAVNYAFDRAAAMRLSGGQAAARVTCQLLPPNFPGYQPYCPFTVDPNPSTGAWSRPDLKQAQHLVNRSGTRRARVVVSYAPLVGKRLARYVVDLLRSLGYRPVLNTAAVAKWPSGVYPLRPGLQAYLDGWVSDYVSAGDFLQLFQCGNPSNATHMCDQRVERAIRRATRAQISRPDQASELWAQAEHLVVRLSPAVDFLNEPGIDFLSERVGNYQRSLQWGLLLDQLWVR